MTAPGTTMPKASINKYRQSFRDKYEIRIAWEPVWLNFPITESGTSKRHPECNFRSLVANATDT
jgi:hypothetical protein